MLFSTTVPVEPTIETPSQPVERVFEVMTVFVSPLSSISARMALVDNTVSLLFAPSVIPGPSPRLVMIERSTVRPVTPEPVAIAAAVSPSMKLRSNVT